MGHARPLQDCFYFLGVQLSGSSLNGCSSVVAFLCVAPSYEGFSGVMLHRQPGCSASMLGRLCTSALQIHALSQQLTLHEELPGHLPSCTLTGTLARAGCATSVHDSAVRFALPC